MNANRSNAVVIALAMPCAATLTADVARAGIAYGGINWSVITNAAYGDGANWEVRLPATNSVRCFRLMQP